jgi:hypothetical protein
MNLIHRGFTCIQMHIMATELAYNMVAIEKYREQHASLTHLTSKICNARFEFIVRSIHTRGIGSRASHKRYRCDSNNILTAWGEKNTENNLEYTCPLAAKERFIDKLHIYKAFVDFLYMYLFMQYLINAMFSYILRAIQELNINIIYHDPKGGRT